MNLFSERSYPPFSFLFMARFKVTSLIFSEMLACGLKNQKVISNFSLSVQRLLLFISVNIIGHLSDSSYDKVKNSKINRKTL